VLSQDGMQSVLHAMKEYQEVMLQHGVKRCRAVATAAVREVANAEAFLALASTTLGHQVEVITGAQQQSVSQLHPQRA
jgi:exopolyphosphatase/guanosine-5'-triphosphate,3'-diphosphate pyrophosphatase